jgi:hypothetical protein
MMVCEVWTSIFCQNGNRNKILFEYLQCIRNAVVFLYQYSLSDSNIKKAGISVQQFSKLYFSLKLTSYRNILILQNP